MTAILMRPGKVALMLDISKSKVYQLIHDGKLKAHNPQPGKKGIRIYTSSVEEYIVKYAIPPNFYER